jgi:hypothetical protein
MLFGSSSLTMAFGFGLGLGLLIFIWDKTSSVFVLGSKNGSHQLSSWVRMSLIELFSMYSISGVLVPDISQIRKCGNFCSKFANNFQKEKGWGYRWVSDLALDSAPTLGGRSF